MFAGMLRHWKLRDRQATLKADIYGNNVGPFRISPLPPGEFGKDWDTDASDIWIIGDHVVMFYGKYRPYPARVWKYFEQ